jgi:hypothetical protein
LEHDADDYFNEIEAHFAFRRGTPFVLSGKDWALMKSWQEAGIPLAIVLEALDLAFDSRERSGRKGVISSLSYCRHSVVGLWEERKQQLVGAAGAVPELDPTARVRELAVMVARLGESISDAPGRVFADTARDLDALASKGRSAPKTEEELIEIENRMVDALLSAISPDARARMLTAIDAELERYDIPSDETRSRTREANLRRMLRRDMKIPRLSLFA